MRENLTDQQKKLAIFGTGGQARVAHQVARSSGHFSEIIFVAKYATAAADRSKCINESELDRAGPLVLHFGIGSNEVRRNLARKYSGSIDVAAPLISPHALIAEGVEIGDGTLVMPGAVINTGAQIGQHCIINTGSVVEHDCKIFDCVSIGPHATLCGTTVISELALIGAGAVVLENQRVGQGSQVGAGAVVLKNVNDGDTVVGVPARVLAR